MLHKLKYLKYCLAKAFREFKENPDAVGQISYSQYGEDTILSHLFKTQKKGFFVDIGAHHPIASSNTYHFYLKGWRGINVDATPGSMEPFKKIRPQDTNIEIGVAADKGEATYHIFNAPLLNTFDAEQAELYEEDPRFEIKEKRIIPTEPLRDILKQNNVPKHFEMMNVDVEGKDEEVIRSNDWDQFRPHVLLIEVHCDTIKDLERTSIHKFLEDKGYELFFRSIKSCFYLDTTHPDTFKTLLI